MYEYEPDYVHTLTSDFTFYLFLADAERLASATVIYQVYTCTTFGLFVFSPEVFFHARATGTRL